MSGEGPATYRSSGVDIDAGDRAVQLMAEHVRRATRPEVLGGLGGFAGLFELDLSRWRRPVLATSTDGVGTKLAVARALGRHDTVGIDLVAMVVDDIVVCGAEPLFLTDYIACGRLVPERIAAIVAGVAEGCRVAGAALIGGETAEHPGLLGADEYDLAGAAVGVVEADQLLGPARVRPGDAVVGLAASGLHSNGYSLARQVLLERGGLDLTSAVADLGGRRLGDELLVPTTIFAPSCLAVVRAVEVHAFAHITGGGLLANLERVLPPGLGATLDRSTWRPPPIFGLIARTGPVDRAEMERTFNQGIGMVACVAPAALADAVELFESAGIGAWEVGRVDESGGGSRLIGEHPER